MIRFEPVVLAQSPDLVLVYGDVNSTLAAALVCAKLNVAVGHVKPACVPSTRACRRNQSPAHRPDSQVAVPPSQDGDENLLRRDRREKIHCRQRHDRHPGAAVAPAPASRPANVLNTTWTRLGLVTLHRLRMDDPARLGLLLETLAEISARLR
jgi:UDP-N-acetylglucosamine 2-epimerase (non-hydrolysing)